MWRKWKRNGADPNGYGGKGAAMDALTSRAIIDLRDVVKVYETPAGPFTALRGCLLYTSRCV